MSLNTLQTHEHDYFIGLNIIIFRGVRGLVWIGFEAKYHPIQNKNHMRFGSVWMIILKKS